MQESPRTADHAAESPGEPGPAAAPPPPAGAPSQEAGGRLASWMVTGEQASPRILGNVPADPPAGRPDAPQPGDDPTVEWPVIMDSVPEDAALGAAELADVSSYKAAPVTGPDDAGTAPANPPRGRAPGRRWMVGVGLASAALLLTGASVITLVGRGTDASGGDTDRRASAAAPADPGAADSGVPASVEPAAPSAEPSAPPVADLPAPGHTATAPLDGRTTAGFDVADSATAVTLRTADLGDRLYAVSTPRDSAVVPRVAERDGRVRLFLDRAGGHRPGTVDITLTSRVRWDLRVAGGASLSTIDLSGGGVSGVDLTGGASRINLTLPRPDGTLSVRMTGGVSLFDVRTAGRVPVRVRVGGGADQVVLNGRSHSRVAAGSLFTPASWAGATDRIDVNAAAGMSALTVTAEERP
ncbi:hypothetical protein QLQ12_44185 [Actinoplanes sp. NEAU-A12]|uniref:Adhesin domain-containing protein n=1 Tax=Actinoplanes sandaracinus TaxID=3045177 RepID=A0ABT6X0R0_9ACTN|nr:hypothetical protein [Actinoplanes sandaracinus]MDI6105602.1 hypothetical protein [Actinoplanes sandaracinus]